MDGLDLRRVSRLVSSAGYRLIWQRPRHILVLCSGLDLIGVGLGAALIDRWAGTDLWQHPRWLVRFGLAYVLFSWLFGSYTLLRMPRLSWGQVVTRLGIAALATTLSVVLAYWVFNLPDTFTLGHRRTQLMVLTFMSGWGFVVRLWLRRMARDRQQQFPTLWSRRRCSRSACCRPTFPMRRCCWRICPGPIRSAFRVRSSEPLMSPWPWCSCWYASL